MKLKHWIVVLAIGFVLGLLGSWMKVLHKAYADEVLTISFIIKICCVIFITLKLINSSKLREIMNS